MIPFKTYLNKTKKAAFILCCFFLVPVPLFAKHHCKLYDKRRLIADSTLALTPTAYKIWVKVEDSIINKIERTLRYPDLFIENCITPNRVILSFTYTTDGIVQFHVEQTYNTNGWERELIKNIERAHIETYFKNIKLKRNKTYCFYIPLKWKIKDTKPCYDLQANYNYNYGLAAHTVKTIDKGWIYRSQCRDL